MIPSYGKIWAFGHPLTARSVVGRRAVIEEKIDGSQMSAMLDVDGNLLVRSKGAEIHLGAIPNLFEPSVKHLLQCADRGALDKGVVYRFEALCKPRHNTLTYARVPRGNLVLLDVDMEGGQQRYATPAVRNAIAEHLGVEPVPVLDVSVIESAEQLTAHLSRTSTLGGCLIEGVVVKPEEPDFCQADGKRIIAKYVSEAFKETHRKTWQPDTVNRADLVERITESVSTPTRWEKMVQHMRDDGQLTSSPKDIGALIKRVQEDVEVECEATIKDMLWQAYRKEIIRQSSKAVPQWYKERLLKSAFDTEEPR